MGMMDKFLNAMRLNTDVDDLEEDYYDDPEDDAYFDEEPKKPLFGGRKEKPVREPMPEAEPKPAKEPRAFQAKSTPVSNKVTPMRASRRQASSSVSMAVCVIKPTSVDEAREITETLLMGKTVVLNLEGLDLEIAQRIIDFTSGSCYAIDGNLQKISNYIFIVTPANVDITGDFLNFLDSFDSSSLQSDI